MVAGNFQDVTMKHLHTVPGTVITGFYGQIV